MSNDHKKKNDQPQQVWITAGKRWLLLALAIPILYIFASAKLSPETMMLNYSRELSLIYTISLVWQTSSTAALVNIGAVLIFLGLLAKALTQRSRIGCSLIILLSGGWMFAVPLLFPIFIHQITRLQTLSHQDHLYRLFHVEYVGGMVSPQIYIVVECDSLGLACHYYATPIWLEAGMTDEMIKAGDDYGLSGRLFVNEEDQKLYLQANDDTYSMMRRCGLYDRDPSAQSTDHCRDV